MRSYEGNHSHFTTKVTRIKNNNTMITKFQLKYIKPYLLAKFCVNLKSPLEANAKVIPCIAGPIISVGT